MERRRRTAGTKVWAVRALVLAGFLAAVPAWGDDAVKKPHYPKSPAGENVPLMPPAWKSAPRAPVAPAEIDRILGQALARENISPAARTTDEQFIRRATLDLTGHLPVPADVDEFVADGNPRKRGQLIDKLLASDEYATHWARYWRDVILAHATAQQVFLRFMRPLALDAWLTQEFKANKSWGDMARSMITANGSVTLEDPATNGAGAFLLCHFGPGADDERAASTARVFLGIQIQCAQCHDHPFDIWKRDQFHELAAFFSRTRERQVRVQGTNRNIGAMVFAANAGEHKMPSKDDPTKSTTMYPQFLLGQKVPQGEGDLARRKALADMVTAKDNYWFAASYVNRIWGELMGQAFSQPVDDMGPKRDVVFPELLVRLSSSFSAQDYNPKALFREIMNSEAYQRQIRLGESADEHLKFAGTYPTRLSAESMWESLVGVLGNMNAPQGRPGPRPGQAGAMAGFFARFQGFANVFKREFSFDPSTKSDEVEGSIPQALMLMNSPVIDQRIQAKNTNLLARILKAYPEDNAALRTLYLRTFARKPTDGEMEKCKTYIAKVGNRSEAYEDLLWALINSTEFQTKR